MVKKAGTKELSNGEEDESEEDSSDSSSVYSQSDYHIRVMMFKTLNIF